MIKAVLFDFNGVLLMDGRWHEEAWNVLSDSIRKRALNKQELQTEVHGKTPEDTLNFLLGRPATVSETEKLLGKKEKIYQKIALGKNNFKISADAIKFFDYLDKKNIKKTIATSSPLVLIDFYYKHLKLGNWFPREIIVYNDGTFPGKPAPDIFLKASKKLDTDIGKCLVIEDAVSGILAAQKAGAGKIVFYQNGENSQAFRKVKPTVVVKSFGQIIPELE